MNKTQNITLNNIDELEAEMKVCLKYFETWRESTLKRKNLDKDWEKGCVSGQTFNNLRIQIAGFFQYARYILNEDNSVDFVPFLYSNQSSLESHFSQMRAKGADTPQKYIAAAVCNNSIDVKKGLTSNKCYNEAADENEQQVPFVAMEKSLETKIIQRQKGIADMIVALKSRDFNKCNNLNLKVMDGKSYCLYLLENKKYEKTTRDDEKYVKAFQLVFNKINCKKIHTNFLVYLLANTNIEDCAVAAHGSGSPSASWFQRVLSIDNLQDIQLFNTACQRIVANILVLFRRTCFVSERNKFSSLWYLVFDAIDRGGMFGDSGPFSCLPPLLKSNQTGLYWMVEKLVQIVEGWIYESREEEINTSTQNIQITSLTQKDLELRNQEVNGFFGYAIAMVIKKYDNKLRRAQYIVDEKEMAKLSLICAYLRDMRILHKQALLNKEYMETCYSNIDKMNNHGGLSLVSPHYFDFAIFLVSSIRLEVTEEKILERKNKSYVMAVNIILEKKRALLRSKFDKCLREDMAKKYSSIEQQTRDAIFEDIIKKTVRSIFNCVMKTVIENKTGRYAEGSTKDSHRSSIRHKYANTQMKTDGKRADEAIKKEK